LRYDFIPARKILCDNISQARIKSHLRICVDIQAGK